MRRTFTGLRSLLAPVIAIALACVTTAPAAELAPSGPSNEAAAAAEWSYVIEPNATVKVYYKNALVVESKYVYWGKQWSWAAPDMTAKVGRPNQYLISGKSDGLELRLAGTAQPTVDGKLNLNLLINADRDLPGAVGGGLEWSVRKDTRSLGITASDPNLLADSRGWSWPIGDKASITVEADDSLASCYFNQGDKRVIRTFFQAGQIRKGRTIVRLTLSFPEGTERRPSVEERYGAAETRGWYRQALHWDSSPVDLRFLNRHDRPAGNRGFLKADGENLLFADGTRARFWGGNLAAYALFSTPRKNVAAQAKRMAQLGYNLMRIHHHDSDWVSPNIFMDKGRNTRVLNPRSLDALDWWIKCLEDEGIYVWLDMRVGRIVKPDDKVTIGADDIAKSRSLYTGLDYLNPDLQHLMIEFQERYLTHVNAYTGKAFKDDPGIIAVLVSNENDLTNHCGNMMLPDKGLATHNKLWTDDYIAFAAQHDLPRDKVFQTWLPGPSKLHLNDLEHRFNLLMIADLRDLGLRVPIATTNFWGGDPLYSLPALCDGDLIDVHSYGESEAFGRNPRTDPNYIPWIGAGQVQGKPLTVSEWNVPYPSRDRFTAPLYVASVASLQGWDAPMVYNYSQAPLTPPTREEVWCTSFDPAITGMMPAAALAFRRGHVSPAKKTYCLMPGRNLFDKIISPDTSATIRTLMEQSRFTVGLPAVDELPWLKPTDPLESIVITDPDHDYIPQGQSFVKSDTGELTRDWAQGTQIIDTDRTQAVSGWIGGRPLETRDASFRIDTHKAVVSLTSIDDLPLGASKFILITLVARVVASPGGKVPLLSEPVQGTVTIRSKAPDLELLALGADGRVTRRSRPTRTGDAYQLPFPSTAGTHWFLLKAEKPPTPTPPAPATTPGETAK